MLRIRFNSLLVAGGWLWTVLLPDPSFAVTPMDYYISLVAGASDSGFRDGEFNQARFNNPTGLAFDQTGGRLFVADRGNHRIRVIFLDENNRVETLAGSGAEGKDDGPLTQASFVAPLELAWIPPDQLAVYDQGSPLLRLVDLTAKTVTSVGRFSGGEASFPTGSGIWNLAYRSENNSLYFTLPWAGYIDRMDLKTQKTEVVLSHNALLPNPQALCVSKGRIYVADQKLPEIYWMEPEPNAPSSPSSVSLVGIGQGDQVLELAESDGTLYALQAGTTPLVRVSSPQSFPVQMATAWGFGVNNADPAMEPLMDYPDVQQAGFAISPRETHHFFFSKPIAYLNSIISVKDYGFDPKNPAPTDPDRFGKLTDYDYPKVKPYGTFRILVAGDSRISVALRSVQGKVPDDPSTATLRADTIPKKLELFLNTEASIRGMKTHFEVLTLSHPDMALSSYAWEEIPPLIKKYQVDLVLGLAGSTGYQDYFSHPLTAEGIPISESKNTTGEKPQFRASPGGIASDLYGLCLQKGLFTQGQGSFPPEWKLWEEGGPDIRKDLLEMAGKPLSLLSEKLKEIESGEGSAPKLTLIYVPYRPFPNDEACAFWKTLCTEQNISFLDLSNPFCALKTSYYPTEESEDGRYETAYGSEFIAYLLCNALFEDNLIPFETVGK
jgi:hypothetical protein